MQGRVNEQGGATQRHSLSTCHPDCAPVSVKEDAAVTKLLLVCRLSEVDREKGYTVEGLQVKWRRSLSEVKGRLLQAGEA